MKRLSILTLLFMILVAANGLAVSAETTAGETFYVNSIQDHPNQPTFCDPSCTLRDAILLANDTPEHDTIYFDFAEPTQIRPKVALPNITAPLTIDGTFSNPSRCPAALVSADLLITLSGDRAGTGANGLTFGTGSAGSVVRGLNIIHFSEAGIELKNAGAANMTIVCNHIGIGNNGESDVGNQYGITVHAESALIGGTDIADHNVISGNSESGILLDKFGGNHGRDAVIYGNYIGTSLDGRMAVPNERGIEALAAGARIGGSQFGSRNVISGNQHQGIEIGDEGAFVLANHIGVAVDSTTPLGNGDNGIYVKSGGADGVIEHNIITHNGINGVLLSDSAPYSVERMTIRANKMYGNGNLGIDLALNGDATGAVTLNDSGDSDGGPNGLQNFPILNSAESTGRIQATLAGKPGVQYTIDIYQNSLCDSSGYGEGENYLGFLSVSSANGVIYIDDFLSSAPPIGSYLTATATDQYGNTSEFSNCIQVTEKTFVVNSSIFSADANVGDGSCDTDLNQVGEQCTLRAALQETNILSGGPYRITYDLPAQTIILPLSSPLPTITTAIILDASTNGGASCATPTTPTNLTVTLDGSGLPGFSPVLHLGTGSGGSEIRGLIIKNAPGDGIYMVSNDNIIACNRIEDNGSNGIEVHSDNSRIGAISTYADRNVVVGNENAGIMLTDAATNNKVRGNFVGINENGVADANGHGIVLEEGATANTIGGTLPLRRNVVSGNDDSGIWLNSAPGNTLIGNYIGTDSAGLSAVPNGGRGIFSDYSDHTTVGGGAEGESNLVSGNGSHGISIVGSAYARILGNKVGTDPAGLFAIPNSDSGIFINFSRHAVLGGSLAGEGNLVSGNTDHGIRLLIANEAEVVGNWIGVNGTLSAEIPNNQSGIHIEDSQQVTIGGDEQSEGNVISGNGESGVTLSWKAGISSILNNYIGTTPADAALGNGQQGLHLLSEAYDSIIQNNTIAYNTRDGVRINSNVTNIGIIGNSIFNNGILGIDLNEDWVTANDSNQDADVGANGLQNFPVIQAADSSTGNVTALLSSEPNSTYRIDVFSSDSCNASGHGQGERFLDSFVVHTNASGTVAGSTYIGGFVGGDYLTMTASYVSPVQGFGNLKTSEFSACFQVENAPNNVNPPTAVSISQQSSSQHAVPPVQAIVAITTLFLATGWVRLQRPNRPSA